MSQKNLNSETTGLYPSGEVIAGRYEVVKGPLESPDLAGGMGFVYQCADTKNARPIALKTFKPQYLSNRAIRDRFLREGATWMALGSHPHVVHAFDVERVGDGRQVYIAIEWIAPAEGKISASLRTWLVPGKSLPLEQALHFALQIIRGMKYVTGKLPGFVHRDLKPENILVGRDGYCRITDFGLSATLTDVAVTDVAIGLADNSIRRTGLTQNGVLGTPLYMAPEQWVPGRALDARADIYAFGCLLHEMVVGTYAAEGKTWRQLEQAHRKGLSGSMPHIHEDVATLVQRCVALQRDDRFNNWEELEIALSSVFRSVIGNEAPSEVAGNTYSGDQVAAGWSYKSIGCSYLDIGKPRSAATYFEKAVELAVAQINRELESAAVLDLGTACLQLGQTEQAVRLYERALSVVQYTQDRFTESSIYGNLANTKVRLRHFQEAVSLFEHQLRIAQELGFISGVAHALGGLGTAYGELGNVAQAIAFTEQDLLLERAMEDLSGEAVALGNLGNLHAKSGNYSRSEGYYIQQLELAKSAGIRHQEGIALGNLGIVLFRQGGHERAVNFFQEQLIIAREVGERHLEAQALQWLGIGHSALDHHHRALEFYNQYFEFNPEDAKTLYNRGLLLVKLARNDEAILDLMRAVEIDPAFAVAHCQLGTVLTNQGKLKKALSCFETAADLGDSLGATAVQATRQLLEFVDTHPDAAEGWYAVARVFRQSENFEAAIGCYDNAIEVRLNHEPSWISKGVLLRRLGRIDDAIRCYDRVIELNPRNLEAWCNKASALNHSERYEESIYCSDRALAINSSIAQIWFNKGVALAKTESSEALPCFEQAQRLGNLEAAEWIAICSKVKRE